MKFLADSMLGKLAKWLRIIGFDTTYYNSLSDKELIALAEREERILITRDKKLSKCWIIPSLYIKSEDVEEQLQQIVNHFNLKIEESLGRYCPLCNENLKEVKKEKIRPLIPELVYNSYKDFWQCLKCFKIYWEGTHWENIKKRVNNLKEEIDGRSP